MAARSKAILPVLQTTDPAFEAEFGKLVDRHGMEADDVGRAVRKIIQQVREGGDEALRACVRKYDGVKQIEELEVQPHEIEAAADGIDPADHLLDWPEHKVIRICAEKYSTKFDSSDTCSLATPQESINKHARSAGLDT